MMAFRGCKGNGGISDPLLARPHPVARACLGARREGTTPCGCDDIGGAWKERQEGGLRGRKSRRQNFDFDSPESRIRKARLTRMYRAM